MTNDKVKTISIRDFPVDLWWEAKALANSQQTTVKNLIINLLEKAIQEASSANS
jgi:hypothetical protein